MEHPFDIKAKTLIINIVAIIPVLLYFHRYVWPSSLHGVYLVGVCLVFPWVMMPHQLICALEVCLSAIGSSGAVLLWAFWRAYCRQVTSFFPGRHISPF